MIAIRTATAVLALVAVVAGCAPMPPILPPEKRAEALTGVGEPFQFQADGEAIDVSEQPPGQTNRLSYSDAIRLTLRHSPDVQAAVARVRQAEADARQARLLPNPILSFAFRLPTSGGRPDVEASLTADLLSLLQKPGQISAADHRLRKSVADSLVVVLDVLEAVQIAYPKAQALHARAGISEARRGILRELLNVTEARVKAGEATRVDQLTVQSEQVELETELLVLRSDERQARLSLARLIGQPSSVADWRLDDWTPPTSVVGGESDWIKFALERRPELQSGVWELAALGQEMKVARVASFTTGGDAGIAAENTDGEWTLGPAASVAVPLFDFGQARKQSMKSRIIERRHELTRIQRQIVQDVRSAMERLQATQAALSETEKRVLPLQRDRLTQANDAYRLGLADVLSVRLAEQDFQQARARQIDLQEQVSQAHARLTRAAGGIGTPTGKPLPTEPATKK